MVVMLTDRYFLMRSCPIVALYHTRSHGLPRLLFAIRLSSGPKGGRTHPHPHDAGCHASMAGTIWLAGVHEFGGNWCVTAAFETALPMVFWLRSSWGVGGCRMDAYLLTSGRFTGIMASCSVDP